MSTLSQQEHESGTSLAEQLSRINPRLLPNELGEIIPGYKEFIPMRKAIGLWSTLEAFPKILLNYGQYDKVVLLLSGIAGGGKNSIRSEIDGLYPGLVSKPVSTTTRLAREGEAEGKDYFFTDPESFQNGIANHEFVEWVQQGERFYGLPKRSVGNALSRPTPIVCIEAEMGAWETIEDYISSQSDTNSFVLRVFVLPYLSFSDYKKHLEQTREDVEARLARTGWEIGEAPQRADYLVTNRLRDTDESLRWVAQAIVNHSLRMLSSREHDYALSAVPFQISPGIVGVEDVVKYHDRLV